MFETEVATYEARKAELLDREGDFVVIRGREIVGTYASLSEAYTSGIDRFGSEPFFLHRISRVEPIGMLSPLMSKPETDSIGTYVPG